MGVQQPPVRSAQKVKGTVLWVFESINTLRGTVIQHAACLTRPQSKLTLTLPDIPALRSAIECFMPSLQESL
jgi:hypothetical protein